MNVVYVWFRNNWQVHHIYPSAMAAHRAHQRLVRRGRLSYVGVIS